MKRKPTREEGFVERRIYFFTCRGCDKRRQSYKKSIALKGMCRKCRRNKVSENQMKLLEGGD